MTAEEFKKLKLPDSPGVYFFKKGPKILYIGRATSLRDRVASYFKGDLVDTRGQFLVNMVEQTGSISWEEADSVLEAIILESNLIKKHQPKYNTQEKDDRSYNYVVITDEDFPRVVLVRGRVLEQTVTATGVGIRFKFGPYPQGGLLREALVLIRKIFPFRDAKAGLIPGKSAHENFYRSIGLSPDVSAPDAKKEYAKTIRNIRLFFQGKKKDLVKALNGDMKAYAKMREFEKAEEVKRTLYAVNHIQDVALIKENNSHRETGSIDGGVSVSSGIRIEAYDVAHLSGGSVVGVMTVVESGGSAQGSGRGEPNKDEYRKFKIKTTAGNDDIGGLREILSRRFGHPEWPMPGLIAVDGGVAQKNAAEKVVAETGLNIPVVSIVKDDRHRPRDIMATTPAEKKLASEHRAAILLANAEAHRFAIAYHRKSRRRTLLA